MALTNKLTSIADAIRDKTGKTDLLTLDQMPSEIESITGGSEAEALTVTTNGTYTAPTGKAYSPVTVNVAGEQHICTLSVQTVQSDLIGTTVHLYLGSTLKGTSTFNDSGIATFSVKEANTYTVKWYSDQYQMNKAITVDDIYYSNVVTVNAVKIHLTVTTEAGALITCGTQTYQLGADETEHSFVVLFGTYTVTVTKGTFTKSTSVVVDTFSDYSVTLVDKLLPDGYTQLHYIGNNSANCINTGYIFTQNEGGIEVDYSFISHSGYNNLVGACNSSDTAWFVITARPDSGGDKLHFFMGSGRTNRQEITDGAIDGVRHKLVVFAKDGTTRYTFDSNDTITTTYYGDFSTMNSPVGIFNARPETNPQSYYSTAKIYSVKIYSDAEGTLARNFIPCRNPSGEVGMYDLVTATFFGNSGTGSFIAGPPVVDIPSEYTQLEYIQSSGTEYIDTGIVDGYKYIFEVEFYTVTKLSSWTQFVGYQQNRQSDSAGSYSVNYDTSGRLCVNATQNGSGSLLPQNPTITDIAVNRTVRVYPYKNPYGTGAAAVYDYSRVCTTSNSTRTDSTRNFYLFAICDGGSANTNRGNHRIYSFKFYNRNDETYDVGDEVMYLIPCKRNSDNVAGMYDLVTETFFTNAGSGTFIMGDEVV